MAASLAIQQEALTRAVSGQSFANYKEIFEGFMRKGIPEDQIKPRENVFTYNAWRALGRQVRKGEHGVKCLTFVQCESRTNRRKEVFSAAVDYDGIDHSLPTFSAGNLDGSQYDPACPMCYLGYIHSRALHDNDRLDSTGPVRIAPKP